MKTNDEFERYQKAQKKVKELKGFYRHLLVFVIVMIGLIYINLKYTPEVLWFIWPMIGSIVPLVFHGAKISNSFPFFNKDWEEKKIKQFMEEEKTHNNKFE
ncbi:2TM domain-containing protein [Flavobacterium sediminilitoris]|uniref:2TM domain-containing protein n=1 Tax=Flavobacterium sediminilitoris TaxID=2024526 RepID=A0ABY4HKJ3_9FLAO|nr:MULTISPECIES: 2TM domain-containing protein [Flavobacterium]UOX32837.1 2TM domain-containing protein [Flavobacterium sediminilitoris]